MKRFSVERNMLCLCGSGKKYKNCCLEILSDISEDMDIQKEIDEKNFELALKYARADLTQYMEGVKRDTELFLSIDPPLGKAMLSNDLKALESIIEKNMFVIKQGNLDVDFISILNNLNEVFYNPNWHELLTYYKVEWLYFHQNNVEKAESILSEISYKDISNIKFLRLFLDLKHNELSFSNKSEIIDKIIQGINRFSEKIQYMGAKGVEYLSIGDLERAKEIFIEAVLIAEENINKFKETYDYFQLANLYTTTGDLCKNKGYIEKAITYYLKISEDKNVTSKGISDVYSRLGKAFTYLGDEVKALEHYHKSIEVYDNPLPKIFIAHVYISKGEFDKALNTLNGIDSKELEEEEKIDFVLTYAQLVLLSNNKNKVEDVLTKLKKLEISSKYFNDIKSSLIIDLQEVLYSPTSEVKDSKIRTIIRKINDYVQLQPNINGIGLNINKMISDYLERKTK